MKRNLSTWLGLLVFLSSSHFSGCAILQSDKPAPETKIAVLRVAAGYLDQINRGNYEALHGLIVWADYLQSRGGAYSKQAFQRELGEFQRRYPVGRSPLTELDVQNIEIDGNQAEIKFRKFNEVSAPTISVDLIWNGSGWLVTDDSIFGPGRVFGTN